MSDAPRTGAGWSGPLFIHPTLLIVYSITLITVMGVSSITPILPAVGREYGITPQEAGWLVAAFTLPGVVLTPIGGLLADRYGRKRVLVPSILLFAVAGHACAYAAEFDHLLMLRAVQGIGAAALGALYATLIGDRFEGNERATAMGYNAAFISSAAALYPLIGGALALFGWRYPFALPLIGFPVALVVMIFLRTPEPRINDHFRIYLRKLAVSLTQGRTAAMLFSGFVSFLLLYGPLVTYMPFLLEDKFGATSVEVGLVFTSVAAGSAAASPFFGRLMRRYSTRALLVVSSTLMAAAVGAIPFLGDIWVLLSSSALFGATHGIAVSAVQVILAETTGAEQRGAVMALNATTFRLGQTLGPLMRGALLAAGGMDAVYLGGAAVGLATVPLLAWAMRAPD